MTTGGSWSGQQTAPEPVEAVRATVGRGLWIWVLLPALAGIGFTTVQIIEKIDILSHPGKTLFCDVSSTVSCTEVLNAWQSSVLGPPNSLIGAIMFALLASAGLAGLLSSTLSRAYLVTLWGLAVFFLCFATWFMYETAFAIGSLCVWCTGIVTAVVVICAALTRIADRAHAFGDAGFGYVVATVVRSRLDLAVWAVWWLAVAALLWIGLYA
ncbi:MAG TPA: vitamin K epoxide reductase family protein [Candidatus Angelobacter sp.]|nr:vitamin K epoxide reductase family protein [Candidatus Angelobacter sp.]